MVLTNGGSFLLNSEVLISWCRLRLSPVHDIRNGLIYTLSVIIFNIIKNKPIIILAVISGNQIEMASYMSVEAWLLASLIPPIKDTCSGVHQCS